MPVPSTAHGEFFHGHISKKVAERRLSTGNGINEDGTFLFRAKASSDDYGSALDFILSVVYKSKATHHLVSKTAPGGTFLLNKNDTGQKSLPALATWLTQKRPKWPVPLVNGVPGDVLDSAPGIQDRIDNSDDNSDPPFLHRGLSKDDASALLLADNGAQMAGKFLFRDKNGADDNFVLSVVYKGKATHHAVSRKNAEADFTVNKQSTGAKDLPALVQYLRTKRKNWPVSLTEHVPRPGSTAETTTGGAPGKRSLKGMIDGLRGGESAPFSFSSVVSQAVTKNSLGPKKEQLAALQSEHEAMEEKLDELQQMQFDASYAPKKERDPMNPHYLFPESLTRADATALLDQKAEGTFLLRRKDNGDWSMCVTYRGEPTHHTIQYGPNGFLEIHGMELGQCHTLEALVNFLREPTAHWPVPLDKGIHNTVIPVPTKANYEIEIKECRNHIREITSQITKLQRSIEVMSAVVDSDSVVQNQPAKRELTAAERIEITKRQIESLAGQVQISRQKCDTTQAKIASLLQENDDFDADDNERQLHKATLSKLQYEMSKVQQEFKNRKAQLKTKSAELEEQLDANGQSSKGAGILMAWKGKALNKNVDTTPEVENATKNRITALRSASSVSNYLELGTDSDDDDDTDNDGAGLTKNYLTVSTVKKGKKSPSQQNIGKLMKPHNIATDVLDHQAFMQRLADSNIYTNMRGTLDGYHIHMLCTAISNQSCHLSDIRLNGNGLTRSMVSALLDALCHNSSVSALALRNNGVDDESARSIAEFLKVESNHIVLLSLRDNEIGDRGAAAIAAALRTNSTLEELSLRNNDIGDVGVAAFCKVLEETSVPKLQCLSLYDNPFDLTKTKRMFAKISCNVKICAPRHTLA